MSKEVIIIGASGHGKVIADIIEKSGDRIFGFLDDADKGDSFFDYPVLGKIADCTLFSDKLFIIAIGNNSIRQRIADEFPKLNYYTAIHPQSIISRDVTIEEGTCVMSGAVINASAQIGKHCIINSNSVTEHDCKIDDFVHLSPNATLCGTVFIGKHTHIGAGAVVRNNTNIAENVTVGCGGVVVRDINKSGTYIGVPAKELL